MADNNIITLDIYEDEDMEVLKRTATAHYRKIGYGTIRKIVRVAEAQHMDAHDPATAESISDYYGAVDRVLHRVFPDITEEEWDCIPQEDINRVIPQIIQQMQKDVSSIPTTGNEKN